MIDAVARQGARGLRAARAARERGGQALPRVRHRRRPALRAARALRRRAAASAHDSHRDRPAGGAARAAVRAVAARPQQRAARPGRARPAAARRARRGAVVAPLLARPARLGAVTDLRSMVREVQDFPTPGVGFKDVTPLLADPATLRQTVGELATWVKGRERRPRARRRGTRLLARLGDRRRGRRRVHPGAPAGQAAAGDRQRELRARVRRELARAASRPDPRRARGS